MKKALSLLLAGLIVVSLPATAFADFTDNLAMYTASASNAIMSVSNDVDSGIMPMSSVGTVTNTVKSKEIRVVFDVANPDGTWYKTVSTRAKLGSGNRYRFSYVLDSSFPSGYYIYDMQFILTKPSNALPSPAGNYEVGLDFSSATGISYLDCRFQSRYVYENSITQTINTDADIFRDSSGDFYALWNSVAIRSSYPLAFFYTRLNTSQVRYREVAGSFAINFTPVSSSGAATAGPTISQEDYNSDVSSSLTDISSSVGEMSSDIDSMASDMAQAAAELSYISNSQQLIIQGIDNVILHISDQLYAFWDQLFNLIHLPQMDMLGQILQAIKDVNIDVTLDLNELKSTINNMSSAIQNKIQSQITNDDKNHKEQISNDNANHEDLVHGYDNSAMNSDKDKLDTAISDYESAEDALLEDVKGHINDFEFKDYLTEIIGPLSDISYFLQGIFTGLGAMNIAVSFSLTLSIALILIGWYRFKGGG